MVVECKDIITQYLETRVVFWSLTRDRFIAMDEEIRLEGQPGDGADMGRPTMNEVTALVKAIRAIPSTPGKPWNPRVAFETFVQHALMSMAHIHADTKGHLDTKVLAFGPLKKMSKRLKW